VRSDFYSIHGNKGTVVLQGTVNESGQILNEIGATIEVARNSVCDDFEIGCGEGLHVGSRDYAEGWAGADGKVVLVEFSPEDAVSVPKDSNYQKLRVSKYIVRSECTRDIKLNDVYTSEHTPQPVWDGDPDVFDEDEDEDGCNGDCGCQTDGMECDCPSGECDEDPDDQPVKTEEELDKEYDSGWLEGNKDGKGHKARQFRSEDDIPYGYTGKFVSGYCDGYWEARHKSKIDEDMEKDMEIF
jgi:hypothetical protein